MTIQRRATVTEITSYVDLLALDDMQIAIVTRANLEALLDHIDSLEYEVAKLKGTAKLVDLHEAFNRRAD